MNCTTINETTTCTGEISVVPYNQDIIIVLLTLIAFGIMFVAAYIIYKESMR